jgi:multiple sugar transport system ATP-binding protein
MSSLALDIAGLGKSFGSFAALDDVTLAVRPAEFVSILGPSGCGKSTLLRVIAGLEDADRGDVLIGGRSVARTAPKDRGIAFVFQSYALYPHLSVRDNIAAPLVMRDLTLPERLPLIGRRWPGATAKHDAIEQRVRAMAELLRIEPFLDRRPSQLSGGQRQRVALARAIIRTPELFLLDEPLANLDASLRNHTRSELAALQKRLGTTTLFVTHDQAEAMAISDRIAVMFAGKVRQFGTPDELYRHPSDLDVARFFSQPHLNVLPAKAIVSGHVAVLGETLAIADAREPGTEGVVAFRPEQGRLSAGAGEGGLAATVRRVEHAGSEAYIFVSLASGGDTVVIRIASQDLARWPAGSTGYVGIDPALSWFFPRHSGATVGAYRPSQAA